MEISKADKKNSVKIKTRTITIVADPQESVDCEVVIFTTPNYSYSASSQTKLVIQGAGEYEVGGVAIKGDQHGTDTIYKIIDQNKQGFADSKIVILPSTLVSTIKDEDEYDALLMRVAQKIDKNMLSVSGSDTLLLYGGEEEIPENTEVKKMNKVNLKKKEEIKGFVIFLG